MTVESESVKILQILANTSFEECYQITRSFENLPNKPCIYAVRHKVEGLLYIGKARNTFERFRGGHKAFLWAWLERYDPDDVRLITHVLPSHQWVTLSLKLETLILQASRPPYNVKIPMEE
jgi:excinuclease UvrABC nuclease subunit